MRFVERAAKKAAAKGGARYFERTGTAWQFMKIREIVEKLGRREKWKREREEEEEKLF